MHKTRNLAKRLWNWYLLIGTCFCIASCMQPDKKNTSISTNTSVKPPVMVTAGTPHIVNLDTCPKPQRITIPVKDSGYYTIKSRDGERRLKLVPPVIRPANFFVTMPNFNTDQGLGVTQVYSCLQDKTGNLWFATAGGGVTRYDGKSSISFMANQGLGNNSVSSLAEDRDGNIWFGLDGGGIAKYDGRAITSFTTSQGLINNEVQEIAIDKKGDCWIATRQGISCFDGNSFKNFTVADGLANNEAQCVAVDKKGNIWMGTVDGLSCYNGKSFMNFSTSNGLVSNSVTCITEDKHGNIWLGYRNGGVSMYNGKIFKNFTNPELTKQSIHRILEDKTGNLWFGTYRSGLFRYDGKSFVNISTKQGLADNIVYGLTQDRSGNIWIGTYNGASCYPGETFISFSTAEGLPDNAVRNIIEDNYGNYWFSTNSNGVCRYDGSNFTIYDRSQGLPHVRIHRIFKDKAGDLWFCTGDGVSFFDGKSFTNYSVSQGLTYPAVRCVLQDKKGDLWFGTEVGLSKFNGKSFSNFTTRQGLPYNNVRDIVEDKDGNLWMGFSTKGGIVRYDGKTFINLDTAQGLTSSDITSITIDSKGNIWIGTGNRGVNIIRKSTIKQFANLNSIRPGYKLFENFTSIEGLSNDVVWDIVEDKQGNIIIGGNLGFTVIKGGIHPQIPISKNKIEYYNSKSGFPGKDILTQAMYVDTKGMIWAGTGNKLVRFDYSAINKNLNPPEVRIQQLKINNEKLSWYNLLSQNKNGAGQKLLPAIIIEESILYGKNQNSEERDSITNKFRGIEFDSIMRYYPIPVNPRLPYRFNNVTFDFAAIEPARPQLVKYQYILEGYDKQWNPVSEKTTASFGNINEGTYTFKVKAMSPDGIWSQPVIYSFVVLPPWYRSLWAYMTYTLSVLFIFYAFYRNRINRLQKKQALQLQTIIATQEEERKRISRDLHDDVGTKLSALKLFLTSLKNNTEKKQYQQIDQLAVNSEQLINETIKDVREMLLNLSPGVLEEFGFTTAIEGLVGKINQTNTIRFELSVFGFKDNLKKEYELALYRITQELINNVLKHSEAMNVSLQIGYRDEKIIIMIEDDGKGFDLEAHKNGYGLKNLDARTKLLNGSMNIDSQPGKGTSVAIEVPYKFI